MTRNRTLLVAILAGVLMAGGIATARPLAPGDDPPRDQGSAAPTRAKVAVASCERRPRQLPFEIHADEKDLCGSMYDDVLVAQGGNHIVWAFQGNDVIRARNTKPDEIWGGPGADVAIVDRCADTVHGIEQRRLPKKLWKCGGAARRVQASGLVYPRTSPRVTCEGDPTAPRVRFVTMPRMRAVDSTTRVDWQTVAWSGLLYRRDGTTWTLVTQTPWYTDRTYDLQGKPFAGNVWRDQTTRRPARPPEFPLAGPGSYRVGVRYHWYAARGVRPRDQFGWVTRHGGPFAAADGPWCQFSE